jgi:hypothetical protein
MPTTTLEPRTSPDQNHDERLDITISTHTTPHVGVEAGDRWIGIGRSLQALVVSPFVSHNLRPVSSKPNQADLQILKELIDAGKVTPVIDRTYSLSEVPDAIRCLHEGRARGKLVISLRGEDGQSAHATPVRTESTLTTA